MAAERTQQELFLMLQHRVENELREAIRAEHQRRAAERTQGSLTAEAAAGLFEASAQGVAQAARIIGFTFDLRSEIARLVQEIAPRGSIPSPRPSDAADSTPLAERATLPQVRCDILLAEDSQDSRELWTSVLEKRGYVVRTASDGPGAISQALEQRPRVLLLDIHLPGIDGYDVARAVRDQLGGSVYIIAITGYGQTEDRTRALAAGCDHHMVKPVSIDALERILARVCGDRS